MAIPKYSTVRFTTAKTAIEFYDIVAEFQQKHMHCAKISYWPEFGNEVTISCTKKLIEEFKALVA